MSKMDMIKKIEELNAWEELIQKHIVNIEIQGTFYESLADVDGDGIITIKDATSVQIILIKSQAA